MDCKSNGKVRTAPSLRRLTSTVAGVTALSLLAAGCEPPPEAEAEPAVTKAATAQPNGTPHYFYRQGLQTGAVSTPVQRGVVSSVSSAVGSAAVVIPSTGVTWTMRGRPGGANKIAGCRDGSIYALNTDRSLWRNTSGGGDTGWVFITNLGLTQDITCSDRLFAFNDDRQLFRNDGTPTSIFWTRLGRPQGAKQITAGWGVPGTVPALFALNDDNSIWQSATGADGSWTRIGQLSGGATLSAGRTGIWAFNTAKDLWRGTGFDNSWVFRDHPGGAALVSDDGSTEFGSLWALNTDKTLWHGQASSPNGIEYQGGPVLAGTPTVYFLWYGAWSATDKQNMRNFVTGLSGSPYFNLNGAYGDRNGAAAATTLRLGQEVDLGYAQGTTVSSVPALITSKIRNGTMTSDPNGIYVVLASADVGSSGYCSQWCGYHTHADVGDIVGRPMDGKYIFAINAFSGNTNTCGVCRPSIAGAVTPNGSPGADALANILAHEFEETVTDPVQNAWFNPSFAGGFENGDKCAWQFGATYRTATGAVANARLGGRDYLIQQNWRNSSGGGCVMQ
jgi:hypothetical protein